MITTRCPNCDAVFRVVADQLRLRGGLVRCGECRTVFDGQAHLEALDEASAVPSQDAAITAPSLTPAPLVPGSMGDGPERTEGAAGVASEKTPAPADPGIDAPVSALPVSALPVGESVGESVGGSVAEFTPEPTSGGDMPSAAAPADRPAPESSGESSESAPALQPEGTAEPPIRSSLSPDAADVSQPLMNDPLAAFDSEPPPELQALSDDFQALPPIPIEPGPPTNAWRLPAMESPHATASDPLTDSAQAPNTGDPNTGDPKRPAERSRSGPLVDAGGDDHPTHASASSTPTLAESEPDAAASPAGGAHAVAPTPGIDPPDTPLLPIPEMSPTVRALLEEDAHRGRGSLVARIAWAMGTGVALLALVLQVAVGLRNPIVAHDPTVRPWLAAVCQPLGCTLQAPADSDQFAIESAELLAVPEQPDRIEFVLRMVNRASLALAYPAIELTLTDANGAVSARRVIRPAEYAALQPLPAPLESGLPARSELSLRLPFLTSGVAATGYSVVLFDP